MLVPNDLSTVPTQGDDKAGGGARIGNEDPTGEVRAAANTDTDAAG